MTIQFTTLPPLNIGDTVDVEFYDPSKQQTIEYKSDVISISGTKHCCWIAQ